MIIDLIKHALMITSFVLMMMLFIELVNIYSRGIWQNTLRKSRFTQYFIASLLGVIPGCLGAFTVVSLYSHRMVGFGALVAAMIATSGDEAFVMLSMFPKEALYLNIILFLSAFLVAYIVDFFFKNQDNFLNISAHKLKIHKSDYSLSFSASGIYSHLKHITFIRAFLITLFVFFLMAVFLGGLAGNLWDWKKITFTLGAVISLLIIIGVPNHFLEEHIYEHVIKKHLIRIFLWTFSALLIVHLFQNYLNIENWLRENSVIVVLIASFVGIIPESGPHLVFATMYANGLVPFAVLLASSISQDGHGTLPILAVSLRAFIWLKIINIIAGILIGIIFLYFMR